MWYCNLDTQQRLESLPTKIPGIQHPNWTQLLAVGWRYLDDLPEPPEGEQLTSETYSQAVDPEHATGSYTYEEIPVSYPTPESVVPVIDEATGNQTGTARLVVDKETYEIIAVIDTASPKRPWPEQLAQFKAKMAAKIDKGAGIRAAAASTKAAAQASSSVPQLKAQVAALSDIVDMLVDLAGV